MPQSRKRQLSIEDALKQPTLSIDDALARPVVAQPAPQPQAAQEPEGMFSSFQTSVAGPLLRNVVEPAIDFYNAPGRTLERVGRGALEFISAFDPAGNAYDPTGPNAQRVAELRGRAEAERPEPVRMMERGMQVEEAKPRTTAGRVAGGIGRVLGEVAFPTAPENIAGNIITAPFGAAAFKAGGKFVAPILQRIRAGRNVGVAAEVAPVPRALPSATEGTTPPAAGANPVVQRAMAQFEAEVARIKTLPQGEQTAAMESAIQSIGREASGARPVSPQSRAGYPPLMEFPENPNPIQMQAGRLPGEGASMRGSADIAPMDAGPPTLEADFGPQPFGVRAAPELAYSETTGPSLSEAQNMAMRAAKAKTEPLVSPDERAAMLEEFLGREPQPLGKTPQQNPLVEGIPGPATEAERAALLESNLPKSKAAGQQELFTGRTLSPAERTPLMQTISSFVKAGMLTKPTTHLKNLGGNLGFQVSEEVARIPGAIVDMMISPFTKRRTLTGPNLASVGRSAYNAATKGVDDAVRILKTGRTPTELEGLQEIASGSKVVDTYVNGVFRLLKAEDAVFKAYAFKRAFEDRVRSAVLTEIRKGVTPRGQYAARVRELTKFPPADLANGAVLDAEVATFNNANITGSIRTGISNKLEKFGKKYPAAKGAAQAADFAIDRIIPFAKTPANVIARMLEYTPIGGVKNVAQVGRAIAKKSFTAEQQRAFSQTFGRAASGSGLLALGYVGYRDGWLTGLNEDDTSKRARDTATGRIPGAIRIGNTWHQITGFSPLGNVIAIGATLAREAEQEQKAGKLGQAGTVAKVAGQAALEQPLLAGTKQFIEGVEQPGTMGARLLGSTAGSVVPGIVSDVGQLADYGTQREAKTLGARVMERIPGVRQTLPVRQDVLGQPTQAPNPLNPLRSTQNRPELSELVRLDIGISGFQKKAGQSDEDLRAKTEEFGRVYLPYYFQLVGSPQYQRATDEIRQDAIKKLNERAKELVEKGKERFARGPLSPAALIGAATGSAKRQAAKKKRGQ